MKTIQCTILVAGLLCGTTLASDEPVAEAPIRSLGLFKNGTVAITRHVVPPKPGEAFLLPGGYRNAHGTLWVESATPLKLTTVRRSVSSAIPATDIVSLYSGRRVVLLVQTEVTNMLGQAAADKMDTVFLVGGSSPRVEELAGTVISAYTSSGAVFGNYGRSDFITLKTDDGITVSLPLNVIVGIRSDGVNTERAAMQDALLVEGAGKPFDMTYIAQGASWAPAYRIVLRDDKRMHLSMSTVLRNELEDFRNARITLISGFPSIQNAGIDGLMSPGTTLKSFVDSLTPKQNTAILIGSRANEVSRRMVMEPTVEDWFSMDSDLAEAGTASDMHYRDIGDVSMNSGSSMYLVLDEADADYERVVEWNISDKRNEYGTKAFDADDDELWDAIRFNNPFKAPMTTAPIEVFDGDRLLGQAISFWANPGQTTSANISKALSVSGVCQEIEAGATRTEFMLHGSPHYKVKVDGELRVRNYRGAPIKLFINLNVLGEYIYASPEPIDRKALASGVYSINKRQQLQWALEVEPGVERLVKYSYDVIVRR